VKEAKARWFREDVVAWALLAAASSSVILGSNYWLHRRVLPAERDLPQPVAEPKILAPLSIESSRSPRRTRSTRGLSNGI
jgi:hypothetical protein